MLSQYLVCPEVAISRRIHLWEGKSASTGSLWAGTLNRGGVMREDRCCDRGNFPKAHLSGSRLSWTRLAKARSGLLPTFQRREKKLAVSIGCTTVQGCWMLPRSPGSHRLGMLCCNPSWRTGSWSRQRIDWGVGTSGWSLEWVASVEVCRRWRSCIMRRLRTTTQSLIVLDWSTSDHSDYTLSISIHKII